MVLPLWKTVWWLLTEPNIPVLTGSSRGIFTYLLNWLDNLSVLRLMQMFTAAPFVTAEVSNPPRGPSVGDGHAVVRPDGRTLFSDKNQHTLKPPKAHR